MRSPITVTLTDAEGNQIDTGTFTPDDTTDAIAIVELGDDEEPPAKNAALVLGLAADDDT